MELLFSTVYMGVIVTVGLIGNIYCMNQLRTTALRRYAMNRYLFVIAVSDSGFLISLTILTLYNLGINILNLPVVCQLTYFLAHVCCFLSGWYIVALSSERCLAVYKPLICYTLFSPQRSSRVILLITGVGLFLNSWPLIAFDARRNATPTADYANFTDDDDDDNSTTVEHRECETRDMNEKFYKTLMFYDAVVSCLAPMTFVLTLNALIVRKVITTNRLRRSLTNEQSPRYGRRYNKENGCNNGAVTADESTTFIVQGFTTPVTVNEEERFYTPELIVKNHNIPQVKHLANRFSHSTNAPMSSSSGTDQKITWFLLAISFTHLLLNAPSYLSRLFLAYFVPIGEEADYSIYVVVDQILLLIFYTQFAINFVLYTCRNKK